MQLSLVVIKTNQTQLVKSFYEALGLQFGEERHGNGPLHFSAHVGQTVFEIYPLPKSIEKADPTTRLGFTVEGLDETIRRLKAAGVPVATEPKRTEWGYGAVVKDPDGRSVELNQKQQ
jgi:predicted enzyme related to lactoylglutathione lyase